MAGGRLAGYWSRLFTQLPDVKDLEREPGFLRRRREGIAETREVLEEAVERKGGPIRVMLMCWQGHVESLSSDVKLLFESYLKARGLDGFFKLEYYGLLKPDHEIADELRRTNEPGPGSDFSGYRVRKPEERVDFIVPMRRGRHPDVESAIMMCGEPKPILLHNPFADDVREPYRPGYYLGIIREVIPLLKERYR